MGAMIYVVPQSHCVIIERLGKFSRVVQAGLHVRIPLIENQKNVIADCGWVDSNGEPIACKQLGLGMTVIELADQRLDTPPRNYHTADNVSVSINSVIFWRIVDPEKAVYAVDRLIDSLIDQALNSLRSCIGAVSLDSILTQREKLSAEVTEKVAAVANRWGIVVQRVEIQELKTDDATSDAMRKEMEAERQKRAEVLEAEARAQSVIITAEAERKAKIAQAEGERQAEILRAEGSAKAKELYAEADALYIKKICEAGNIKPEDIAKILLAQKYLEGFNAISKNPADKVFLPNSFGNMNFFVDTASEKKNGQNND